MRSFWAFLLFWAYSILVLFPIAVVAAGVGLLHTAWRGFKAQRGRHGVLPDPQIAQVAFVGMGLLLLGYLVCAVQLFMPR